MNELLEHISHVNQRTHMVPNGIKQISKAIDERQRAAGKLYPESQSAKGRIKIPIEKAIVAWSLRDAISAGVTHGAGSPSADANPKNSSATEMTAITSDKFAAAVTLILCSNA
ncbi:hypothetical protein [Rhodanobacter sp. BL-MT-08]